MQPLLRVAGFKLHMQLTGILQVGYAAKYPAKLAPPSFLCLFFIDMF